MADAVSLDSLIVSGEFRVQFGVGSPFLDRTAELHRDAAVYCFTEPKHSMAKHLREKLYVTGCRVVDCGTYRGQETLAVFLLQDDYAEGVDNLGIVQSYPLRSPAAPVPFSPSNSSTDGSHSNEFARGCSLVLLHAADRRLKTRFRNALQRASDEYPQLFASSNCITSALSVRNNFDNLLLGRPRPPCPSPSTESELSMHEVLQLDDVLQEYERIQREGRRAAAIYGDDELPDSAASETVQADGAFASDRLRASPLYLPCLEGNVANAVCADCTAPRPSWAVLQPFGSFVCIHCVGVHRQLWANKCREVEMDLWTPEDVSFMQSRGNAVVNAELEYCVAFPRGSVEATFGQHAYKPVEEQSSSELRRSYIQAKYQERLFTREAHQELLTPEELLHDRVGLAASTPVGPIGAHFPTATSASPVMEQDGPPHYKGLLNIVVKELVSRKPFPGSVCSITNGFQTLHSKPGRRLPTHANITAWDELLQLGVEMLQTPLYCCIFDVGWELIAAAEFYVPDAVRTGSPQTLVVEFPWCQLHVKPDHRHKHECWRLTMLLSLTYLN